MTCGCDTQTAEIKKVRRGSKRSKRSGKAKLRAAIPRTVEAAKAAKRKIYVNSKGRQYITRKGRKVYLK